MYQNLIELNPEDVKGSWKVSLEEDLDWVENFDLVIGTDLSNEDAIKASKKCQSNNRAIPFVLIR